MLRFEGVHDILPQHLYKAIFDHPAYDPVRSQVLSPIRIRILNNIRMVIFTHLHVGA